MSGTSRGCCGPLDVDGFDVGVGRGVAETQLPNSGCSLLMVSVGTLRENWAWARTLKNSPPASLNVLGMPAPGRHHLEGEFRGGNSRRWEEKAK